MPDIQITNTNKPAFVGSQLTAFSELEDFSRSGDSRCFILKGYAGTGKTYLINELVRSLAEQKVPFRLMSPTGRAAKVLNMKTGRPAYTIHKSIYNMMTVSEEKNGESKGLIRYSFSLADNTDPDNTIYIADEASMISDEASESSMYRFGSGCLLSDMIEYTGITNPSKHTKLLLVGDNAQLPPVKSELSPALSEVYLYETYGIKAETAELRDVIRQDGQSGILKMAVSIREGLNKGSYDMMSYEYGSGDISFIPSGDFFSRYFSEVASPLDDEAIVVAFTNKKVSDYNRTIRQGLFPGQKSICQGDRILAVANRYGKDFDIFNGDFGTVIEISPEVETLSAPVNTSAGRKAVQLGFREAVLRFRDPQNEPHDVRCKIVDDLLYSENPDLTREELSALFVSFKMRNSNLKAGTDAFRDALRSDPYLNAVRIKFGYAATCHKAQGGEWEKVFVDFSVPMPKNCEQYFRLAYTAITRSSSRLYCINQPYLLYCNMDFDVDLSAMPEF